MARGDHSSGATKWRPKLGCERIPRNMLLRHRSERDRVSSRVPRNLKVQQRCVLLCPEDVGLADISRHHRAADRDLDCVALIELDDVGHTLWLDAVKPRERVSREYLGTLDALVRPRVVEDNVECEEEIPSVLA